MALRVLQLLDLSQKFGNRYGIFTALSRWLALPELRVAKLLSRKSRVIVHLLLIDSIISTNWNSTVLVGVPMRAISATYVPLVRVIICLIKFLAYHEVLPVRHFWYVCLVHCLGF